MDSATASKDDAIRKEIAEVCHQLYQRQMVSSTGGNVSVRLDDQILITPTGRSLRAVRAEEIVQTDLSGNAIDGGIPSKEVHLHSTVYRARAEVRAVIHVHSPYSIALSCRRRTTEEILPPITPGYVLRVGKLQLVPYYRSGSLELAAAIEIPISHHNAVMLQNHGLVVAGTDLEQAVNIAEEVEENAKIYILAGEGARVLTVQEVQEILVHFRK